MRPRYVPLPRQPHSTTKRCTLEVHEFIARFLQHVLPTGFTKVRSYGLFAPSDAKNLKRARESLAVPQPAPPPSASQPHQQHDTLIIRVNGPAHPPPRRCTACSAGVMRLLKILPRQWRSPP